VIWRDDRVCSTRASVTVAAGATVCQLVAALSGEGGQLEFCHTPGGSCRSAGGMAALELGPLTG
jgi:hypothetical protein